MKNFVKMCMNKCQQKLLLTLVKDYSFNWHRQVFSVGGSLISFRSFAAPRAFHFLKITLPKGVVGRNFFNTIKSYNIIL